MFYFEQIYTANNIFSAVCVFEFISASYEILGGWKSCTSKVTAKMQIKPKKLMFTKSVD